MSWFCPPRFYCPVDRTGQTLVAMKQIEIVMVGQIVDLFYRQRCVTYESEVPSIGTAAPQVLWSWLVRKFSVPTVPPIPTNIWHLQRNQQLGSSNCFGTFFIAHLSAHTMYEPLKKTSKFCLFVEDVSCENGWWLCENSIPAHGSKSCIHRYLPTYLRSARLIALSCLGDNLSDLSQKAPPSWRKILGSFKLPPFSDKSSSSYQMASHPKSTFQQKTKPWSFGRSWRLFFEHSF